MKRWLATVVVVLAFLLIFVVLERAFEDMYELPRPIWLSSNVHPAAIGQCYSCDSVAILFDSMAVDPVLGRYIVPVREKLDEYRRVIERSYAKAAGKRITVVLQIHEVGYEERVPDEILKSQGNIKRAIPLVSPELIAWEGVCSTPLTEDNLLNEVITEGKRQGLPSIERDSLRRVMQNMADEDAMTWYLARPNPVFCLGSEIQSLHLLHTAILDTPPWQRTSQLDRLVVAVRILRSEIALAKAIHHLDSRGLQHGLIVIGVAHGPELAWILDDLGIQAAVYDLE